MTPLRAWAWRRPWSLTSLLGVLVLAGMLEIGEHRVIGRAEALSDLPKLSEKAGHPSDGLAPCSERYPPVATLRLEPGLSGEAMVDALKMAAPGVDRIWGIEENARTNRGDGRETTLRVGYPQGSYVPSADKAPLGGAGFVADMAPQGLVRACLRYRVRFEEEFRFNKGGKLPGLYGGGAPTGGGDVDADEGFSMRLMWRDKGAGEIYAYVANKRDEYGDSIGRGRWTFEPGRWSTVEQEVILNEPGEANGVVRLWVDGNPVIEQSDLVYRTGSSGRVDGLMFSTFFGGNGKSWASPRDQYAEFSDFRLFGLEDE